LTDENKYELQENSINTLGLMAFEDVKQ